MRIAPTQLGDESLALAEDGDIHVSIGFIPDFAHDEWNDDRSAVTRHACTLLEISLVPFPAYEGADVLAVRSGVASIERVADVAADGAAPASAMPTPNLDQVRLWHADRSEVVDHDLSRRWHTGGHSTTNSAAHMNTRQ